jgi:hypothetical protein
MYYGLFLSYQWFLLWITNILFIKNFNCVSDTILCNNWFGFLFFILELKENKILKMLKCGFLSNKAIDDADNKIARTLEKRY